MPRALLMCITIVAAFALQLSAAEPPVAHVPVTSPVAALAERVGMDVERDRGRFVSEIVRRLYSPPLSRQQPVNLVTARANADGGVQPLVDVPLTAQQWSDAVFHRVVPPSQLIATILSDRRAALLCRGLAAADDDTLTFYAEHPALLSFLYEHGAAAFGAFADSLHVREGHLVVPGGAEAERLWEAAAHAPTSSPDAFIRALFIEPEARLAYLYDVLATAEPSARAFALGLWIDNDVLRANRFLALALGVRSAFHEWHVAELPFVRPLNDLAILLLRIRVSPNGSPLAPAQRRFWAAALDANAALDAADTALAAAQPLVDAAWLLQATSGDMYARGEKLDQFSFGQRVFGARGDAAGDAESAVIREMLSRRMLLLGLDRIGITNPDLYAAALRQARSVLDGGSDRFWTFGQQQGALAILIRLVVNGTIARSEAETVARSLFAVPVFDGEFKGGVADWMQSALATRLPGTGTWEERLIAGLAGGPTPDRPIVDWEGQTYRLDLAFAERRRIEDVRRRQGGPDLDVAFAVTRLARRAAQASSAESLKPVEADAQQLIADAGPQLARPPSGALAPGVPVPRDGRDWLTRAMDDVDRGVRGGDARRVARGVDSLTTLGDTLLGYAMLSVVYATDLGDPEGPALLGVNVALRHDYGFARRDGEGRARTPWAQPRQDFQPGVPWHVVGSLVGLDVALAPLSLRRLRMDGLDTPPRLPSIEREAFAVNVTLLEARELRDSDRDRLVAAIARGRARVRALVRNPDALEAIKDEIAADGWRGRTVRWILHNEPDSIENQFSLAELVVLGGESGLDAWGANGLLSFGCVCTRFPGPRTWRILSGRPQMAMMAASTVEMNLEIAQRTAALRLPASLVPSILMTAMQDFVDQAGPADPGDRDALLQYGRAISGDLVDDYVAATATLTGPLVGDGVADASEP